MSNARFSILQARAVKDKRISDSQFRTLAALGMYADSDGWCFPMLSTLGEDLQKSKQAVGRDTIALKKLGYLEVYGRWDKNGARRSNLYRLRFDFPISQHHVDTPSTPEVDTPSTPEVDVNDPYNAPNERAAAILSEMPIEAQIVAGVKKITIPRSQIISNGLREHFKLTPRWASKYDKDWMQWAISESMTDEQIKNAAEVWRSDKRFNWQVPSLKGIAEHWLELRGNSDEYTGQPKPHAL